ncbi:hypothetical protein CP532_0636 [Ophiocordyceps camponoti-leonardi (nom. inval.)]|nr:hypothetical protein CP532_0636 [Ophiocordyceps camponoti-leonardi (nom. inval.)]
MRSLYVLALALPLAAALPHPTKWNDGSDIDVEVQNEVEYSFDGVNVDQGAVGDDASTEQSRGQEPVNTQPPPSEEAQNAQDVQNPEDGQNAHEAQKAETEKPTEEIIETPKPEPQLSSIINMGPDPSTIEKPTLPSSSSAEALTRTTRDAVLPSHKATISGSPSDSPVVVSTSPPVVVSTNPPVVSSNTIENSPSQTINSEAISPSRIYALNLHNNVRPAHDAPQLKWSSELENKALLWAQQCIFDHPSKNNASESQFVSHSQNIAYRKDTDTTNMLRALYDGFKHWYYTESDWFDYNTQGIRTDVDWSKGPDVGHFKNIASRNLDEMGCATHICPRIYMDRSKSEYGSQSDVAFTVCDFARKDKRERLPTDEYNAFQSRKEIVPPVGRVPPIEEARWDVLQKA